MQHSRQPSEQAETEIDPKVGLDAAFEDDGDEREEDGDEVEDDVRGAGGGFGHGLFLVGGSVCALCW